jgi:hypothetical protein
MNGVTLHVHPPESMLDLHHAMLSSHEGVLPLVQFPLLYQEVFPQLHNHSLLDHCI